MKHVQIYTDGSCVMKNRKPGATGRGGWAAILTFKKPDGTIAEREISGSEKGTTNNRMELQACIEALRALSSPCRVTLFTDSEYVKKGITEWMQGWVRNGWKTADKKPVKNKDLWMQLDEEEAIHEVTWEWVRGHNGDPMNERVDRLSAKQSGAKRKDFPEGIEPTSNASCHRAALAVIRNHRVKKERENAI